MNPTARAVRTAAAFAVAPAIVAGVLAGVLGGAVFGVVAFLAVGAALAAWARYAGESRIAANLKGRDADPVGDARLCNLVDGLSITAGVRPPRLVVLDGAGLNAMVAGISPRRALLVVTSGMLAGLDRIELEAVLAEELVQIRRNEILPGTVLVATFGIGRRQALRPDRDIWADQGAVDLTRYPPALASALEKIEAGGSSVPAAPSYMAHLWLADPGPSPSQGQATGRLPVRERIEALREL